MNVTYSDRVRQSIDEFALLQQATKQLEEAIGKSANQAGVEWDSEENSKGQTVYFVRISHGQESASTTIDPDELRSFFGMRYRMYRLWGDLLKERQERQLRELQEAVGQED